MLLVQSRLAGFGAGNSATRNLGLRGRHVATENLQRARYQAQSSIGRFQIKSAPLV